MICGTCGSALITYYKQRRKDGVWVVTARCENGHHPIRGKPFYPISQFDIASLPTLNKPEAQLELPMERAKIADVPNMSLLDWFEGRKKLHNRFQVSKRNS